MNSKERVNEIHKEIQQNILKMIPEKYKKICLYASIIEGHKKTTGEMFFYYFPSGILKKKPINVYEIPEIFNIDEDQYNALEKRLYESIKKLEGFYKLEDRSKWSNLTITISESKYKVEFNYDSLITSKFGSKDRHIIWRFKYLELPIESFNKEDRRIIEDYFNSPEYYNAKYVIYEENIYEKQRVLTMDYNNGDIEKDKTHKEENGKKNTEEKEKTKPKTIKNQLLNF